MAARAVAAREAKKFAREAVEQAAQEGQADMLGAMRWVSTHREGSERTVEELEMRRWLRQDVKGFMAARRALEEQEMTAQARMQQKAVQEEQMEPESDVELRRRMEALLAEIKKEGEKGEN
jgi:hypothetical protein